MVPWSSTKRGTRKLESLLSSPNMSGVARLVTARRLDGDMVRPFDAAICAPGSWLRRLWM